MESMFWPIQGDPRLVAMPDAAFRNNSDKSSQLLWLFSWLNLEGRKVETPGDPWFPSNPPRSKERL